MIYGYAGKILRVNLTKKISKIEELNEEDAKKYFGGSALGAKILLKELPKGIDPLSEHNKIIFATGPFVGTVAPGSGSINVCFKSPLNNVFGESRAGSDFGSMLKKAGYDVLIIEGKADRPVYLVINDSKIEIKDASEIAGKSTGEKNIYLKEKLGKDYEIASIGQAGENQVLFSVIMFNGDRAAGRLGGGALMGSKNLYAIAVHGSKRIEIYNKDEFSKVARELAKKLLNIPGNLGLKEDGTTGDLGKCDNAGDWPTKNWRSNSWGKGQELYDKFKKYNLVSSKPCYTGCILQCGRVAKSDSVKWKTPVHGGTEYESISAFTAFILNDDIDAAVYATYLCNEYGLDTISAGAAIAFAMDCYEHGIIKKNDYDLDLNWGNMDVAIKLLKDITERNGLGNVLADGVLRASRKLGRGSEEFAIHVKGLEGAAHDPRSGKALALTYACSNIGMSHIHPVEGMAYDAYKVDFGLIPYGLKDPNQVDRYDEKGKGIASKILHDYGIIPDMIGMCKFYIYAGLTPDDLAKELSALTGWDIDGKELLKIGERGYNVQRMFNVREGIKRKDDYLPKRVLSIPEFGKYANAPECTIKDFDLMLNEYYDARGWDSEGVPKMEKLKELDLEWIKI
ncbi:MAG: aldehyde ferredoxin oxidoreductase family protein [Thermoplasmata archaeon]